MRGSYARIPYAKASNSSEGQFWILFLTYQPPSEPGQRRGDHDTNNVGQEVVNSILGPITTSLDGLKLFYQAILSAKPWDYDPWTPRMPWSDDLYHLSEHGGEGGKLTFGIMWDDGVVMPVPGYKRALDEVKAALIAAGHEGEYGLVARA